MKYTGMNPTPAKPTTLIFSDLDGSLLDHYSYSFAPALPVLKHLESQAIPLICTTSKTFAELLPLRQKLANKHPFIVENGAAVYIPCDYFEKPVKSELKDVSYRDGYLRFGFCKRREHWQYLLEQLHHEFPRQFNHFSNMGLEGIRQATGLSALEASQANQRDFSEPVLWQGDEVTKQRFIKNMHNFGAKVLQGGRFLHISGTCDKGLALKWLRNIFEQQWRTPIKTLAAGDGKNDVPMLEVCDIALIIRSPAHQPPNLTRDDYYLSDALGPAGWAEGVAKLLNFNNETAKA